MNISVRSSTAYEQATVPVADRQAFESVRSAIETSLSPSRVAFFLKSLQRAKLRVRDFEIVLSNGLLGSLAEKEYGRLENGDRGMIRELYLATIERVAPELREKFFKLYAYY